MTFARQLKVFAAAALGCMSLLSGNASAQYVGYMNWFQPDCATYVGGQPWGVADLRASGDTSITLQPNINTYDANLTDAYWVDQVTGDGAKCMQANYYQESVEPSLAAGTVVELSGWVDANTLAGHSAVAIINLFDGAYNFIDSAEAPLTAGGPFSVSMDLTARAGENLVIQSGFRMVGLNVSGSSAAASTGVELRVGATSALGSGSSSASADPVGIPALPLWGLFGLAGLVGLMGLRRKR